MAQAKRDNNLENRTNRLKLTPKKEPYWASLAEGEHIGYYRPKSKAAGTWTAKWRNKETGKRTIQALGTSDDYADADGIRVLNWAQAQARAREWFAEQAQDIRRRADGEDIQRGLYTIAAAMEDYTRDCIRRGNKSVAGQVFMINAHIIPSLGNIEVAKITRGRIEKWMEDLAITPRRVRTKKLVLKDGKATHPVSSKKPTRPPKPPPGPPSTPNEKRARKSSANRMLTILRAALNHAHDRGKVRGETPWRDVKCYRNASSSRTRFLFIEDQVRFVNACAPGFRELVQGALLTGARYGELIHMTVSGYNREAQTVFIPSHISKNGKARHIFLTTEGQTFFNAITADRDGSSRVFQREGIVRRRTLGAGQNWVSGDQDTAMASACEAAKIERLTFHELRHTAASTWIAAGLDLIIVARQLGHSDTRMIEKHYGHLCPNAAAARFRALAPALGILGPEQMETLQVPEAKR